MHYEQASPILDLHFDLYISESISSSGTHVETKSFAVVINTPPLPPVAVFAYELVGGGEELLVKLAGGG